MIGWYSLLWRNVTEHSFLLVIVSAHFARLLDLLYFRRVLSIKVAEEMFFRPTGFLVGPRSQVQISTVEIDRVDEVLFVAKSSSGIFHPLNFGVDGFAGGVGNRMG